MAGVRAQRGHQAGLAARAGRTGLLPDGGPGHRHRPGPQVSVAEDRRRPDRVVGLRRRFAIPGGRASEGLPSPVSRLQGVRRAQRRPRPVPLTGRRAVRCCRRPDHGHRQRGAHPVGRGHTRPRRVHRRDGQPGRRLRGESVDELVIYVFFFANELLPEKYDYTIMI